MLGGLRIGSPLEEGGDTVVDLEVDTVGSDSRLDCALVEFVSNFGAYSGQEVGDPAQAEDASDHQDYSDEDGEQVRPEPRSLVVAEGGDAGCESGQAPLAHR